MNASIGEKSREQHVSELRFPFAGILVAIALLATLFYGVVGEDKAILLAPLAILGYACLAAWFAVSAFSRNAVSAAPPSFYPLMLFTVYGVALGTVCTIPFDAKIRMLFIGLFVGTYFLMANRLFLFRKSRTVLDWVFLFALLTCFYGLVNHFKQPEMVLWAERFYDYEGRLASTYICPNHFAHLLQMLLPFCLVLLFIPQAGLFLRILAGYCMVVYVPTIVLTESRAGMLGAIAAIGVATLLLALRKSKKLFLLLVILVPLATVLLLAGAWNYSEMFKRRMTPVVEFLGEVKTSGFANTTTSDFRPLTWLDTVEMIQHNPFTGFGPGSYRYAFEEYRKRCRSIRVVTGHPHNEYLEVASEYGWVGFGLLAFAWCYGLVRLLVFSLKTPNQHHALMGIAFLGTAAGTMVHSFFDFQMHVFQNALVFSLLAGIAAGPICGRRIDEESQAGSRNGKTLKRLARVALAVVAAAGFVVALQAFSSEFLRSSADRLASRKRMESAVVYYGRAIAVDPSNWRAYKGLGLLYASDRYFTLEMEKKTSIALAEKAVLEQGYLHNPKDSELVMALGKVNLFLGHQETGLDLLKKSAALRPFNDHCWWTLGAELRKAGRYAEALAAFTYAQSLKNTPSIRKNIQWLERQINSDEKPKPASARPTLEVPVLQREKQSLDDLHQLMESSAISR